MSFMPACRLALLIVFIISLNIATALAYWAFAVPRVYEPAASSIVRHRIFNLALALPLAMAALRQFFP
jgi:hypothetical protein